MCAKLVQPSTDLKTPCYGPVEVIADEMNVWGIVMWVCGEVQVEVFMGLSV